MFIVLGEMKLKIREKLKRNDPYFAPIEAGLPPFKSTLNLFHAVIESNVAATELGVKNIMGPMEHSTIASDWGELNKNKQMLSKLFKDSNKVIKENKACCHRFREKIREKKVDKLNLSSEIENVLLEVEEYKNVKNEMENYVDEYSIYEKFLRDIAQGSTEFNSVGDILNRYETLENTRKECARLLEEGLDEATALRRQMSCLVEDKSNCLKELNNKLIMIQVRRKEAKEQRKYWESILQKIKKIITLNEERKINLGGASWDLYRQMCYRRKVVPTAGERDINAQMEFIKKTFVYYKEVITTATAARQARQSDSRHHEDKV